MSHYRELSFSDDNCGGHLHSGIHNRAMGKIMVALDAAGAPLFSDDELAQIFNLALTQHLSSISGFPDRRRRVDLAVRTLFRTNPAALLPRQATIALAFAAAGII